MIELQGLSKRFVLRKRKGPAGLSLHRVGSVVSLFAKKAGDGNTEGNVLWAVNDLTLDVPAGQILGIIGRNGAGKTTLLRILARILSPTRGRAVVRGRVASLLEMGVGFDREATVRENVLLNGTLSGMGIREIERRLPSIAAFANLDDALDTPLRLCPSGSFIRLAFSTVMNLDSDIILADEVLAVGDAAFQEECIKRINAVSESGQTVLFVSHDLDAVRRLCHRVIWLENGRLVMDGPPDVVIAAYANAVLPRAGKSACMTQFLSAMEMRLVSPQGVELGALRMHEPGAIECLLGLEHASASIVPEITILQEGLPVTRAVPLEPITANLPGLYRLRVCFPADLFNEAEYVAEFRFRDVNSTEVQTDPLQVIRFKVYNTQGDASVWGDWRWGKPGLIAPRLQWRIRKLDSNQLPELPRL